MEPETITLTLTEEEYDALKVMIGEWVNEGFVQTLSPDEKSICAKVGVRTKE